MHLVLYKYIDEFVLIISFFKIFTYILQFCVWYMKTKTDIVYSLHDFLFRLSLIACIHKRLHFMRGKLNEKNGELYVKPLKFQGSHSIGSLVDSNALIRVEADSPDLPKGVRVSVRPLINEII